MGGLLRVSPANSQLLGGGLRAGTLRSHVRVIQKFNACLTTAHNVAFPIHRKHLIEYFQVRLSKPCVRGSLNSVRRLLKGDIYIRRGSGQRSSPRSRCCNNFKLSEYGRDGHCWFPGYAFAGSPSVCFVMEAVWHTVGLPLSSE